MMSGFYNLVFILFTSAFVISGCTPSPTGTVEDLSKISAPTFGGQRTRSYTTPTESFVLSGECDSTAYGIEWSKNQVSWSEVPGGCLNSAFSFTVYLNREVNVYVRSKTKFTYTSSSVATITQVPLTTSPYLKFVSSGRADNSAQEGMQNDMSSMSSNTLSNGFAILKSSLVDILYGD